MSDSDRNFGIARLQMNSEESHPDPGDGSAGWQPTRIFLNARREAVIIFIAWFVALCWSVPWCYFNGYGQQVDPQTLPVTMGIPSWLFGGILLPWIVADLFTTWFCFVYMKDDDLGRAGDEEGSDDPVASAPRTEAGAS